MNRRSFVASAAVAVLPLPALASEPRHIVLKDGDDLTAAVRDMRDGDKLTASGVKLVMIGRTGRATLPDCSIELLSCVITCQDGASIWDLSRPDMRSCLLAYNVITGTA